MEKTTVEVLDQSNMSEFLNLENDIKMCYQSDGVYHSWDITKEKVSYKHNSQERTEYFIHWNSEYASFIRVSASSLIISCIISLPMLSTYLMHSQPFLFFKLKSELVSLGTLVFYFFFLKTVRDFIFLYHFTLLQLLRYDHYIP